MSMVRILALTLPLLAATLPCPAQDEASAGETTSSLGKQYEGIVKVNCKAISMDYSTPWNPGTPDGGSGTGWLVGPGLFMTNAHVVSNASRLTINKVGDPTEYPVAVKYIAHDCDLALLELKKPVKAFEGVPPLTVSDRIPFLDTTVKVVGYPIGGERISVTRGVVSRVDYQEYTHSGVDQHLAIQIDAAINPGNSGGPVIQDGKVVGVAFQGYSGSVAQNTGYMIPTPVIHRFLKDVKDGKYDHYVELAISHFPLLNPAQRAALKLQDDGQGVLVTSVDSTGSCGGVLQPGDVLLELDGHAVKSNGAIEIEGEQMEMAEVVERKFAGDRIKMKVWREAKIQDLEVTLKPFLPYLMHANQYEKTPEYVMFAGLVFQPLDSELMGAHSIGGLKARYWYQYYTTDELYKDRRQPVVLTTVLPDELTTYLRDYAGQIVDEVNGVKITCLKDLAEALAKDPPGDHVVVKLLGEGRPVVIEKKRIAAAQKRIQEKYGVEEAARITE